MAVAESRPAVPAVLYDVDEAAEALRLGAALAELMPDEPEVQGLQALMLLNDARRAARFDGGELVLPDELADPARADAERVAARGPVEPVADERGEVGTGLFVL